MDNQRIYKMSFASVYPHYIAKAERKGRTKAEVDEIIRWLTGYTQKGLEAHLKRQTDFETFFSKAPRMNPLRKKISGVVCGVRVEDIKDPSCGKRVIWISCSTSWQREKRWRTFSEIIHSV
jgi:hypothetical protein